MQKFRNDLGGSKAGRRANAQSTATINKMLTNVSMSLKAKKSSRVLKPYEMYSKMHYGKIKDVVKKEQEELKNLPSAAPPKKTSIGVVK